MLKLCFLFLILVASLQGFCQGYVHQFQNWNDVNFVLWAPKKKFGGEINYQNTFQAGHKSPVVFQNYLQSVARSFIHYNPTNFLRISVLGGFWENHLNRELPTRQFTEKRWGVQFQYRYIKEKYALMWRSRFEDRYLNNSAGVFQHLYRSRHQIRFYQSMGMKVLFQPGSYYFFAMDEFFIYHNKPFKNMHTFEQNRVFVGVGRCIGPRITVELGYFNQSGWVYGRSLYEVNHAIQTSFTYDLQLKKKKKELNESQGKLRLPDFGIMNSN